MSPEPRTVNPWIVAIAVMFATFMEVLDTTVVNVSLPHIAGSLSATVEESTWALTSYLVANAIILPLTGWLATYFGRKRLLMASVTGFTAASFLCGLAPNLQTLVFFRIIQGATGGAMQPLSQAVLLEAFPPHERGKAMGFWGLGIVTAPILGPVIGGWLTDTYSWRWVFYINIPVGIASLIMTQLFIFDPPYMKRQSETIDYWGIGMLALGIGALQIVLDLGQREDWFNSNYITMLAVIAAAGLVAFVLRELRTEHPVVDLRVFKVRTFAAGVFLMTTLGFVLYGSLVLLPIMLQTLLGYPPVQAGFAMAPRGIGSFLGMPVIGFLIAKVDSRRLVAGGLIVGGFTLLWLGQLNLNAGYWDIFWPQFLQGLGLSMVFVPLTTISMDPIPKERMGNATSLFNLMRNLGGSIGIAATSTMLARRSQSTAAILSDNVTAYNPASRSALAASRDAFIRAGSDPVTATNRAYAAVSGMVHRQATMVAFVEIFTLLGLIFLALVPLVFVMKRPSGRAPAAAH
ncbi:MAG TPA: DHA2 family efflux MFS transporter permease subunit [Vicinamibacterales bacterium]|jgi:DHA2 family multidrug resistance protein|nr:DHA2 family efflux MFS transporter permease subunit [Vicinamibacterales bacterium]